MTVEILVVRDPDSADEIRVWLDGVERRHDTIADEPVVIVYLDAGAGHEYEDWIETADVEIERTQTADFREAVRQAYADPPGRRYIDGWPEEER